MLARLVLTLCVLTFGALVPAINETHLLNSQWAPACAPARSLAIAQHCRHHALVLVAGQVARSAALASAPALIVTGGFLVAFAARDGYGGSMLHTDGAELNIFGLNAAVIVMGAATAALALIFLTAPRATASVKAA